MNWALRSLRLIPWARCGGIYEQLCLGDFGHVEPCLKQYLGSIDGYAKNTYPALRWKFATGLLGNGDRTLMRGVIRSSEGEREWPCSV